MVILVRVAPKRTAFARRASASGQYRTKMSYAWTLRSPGRRRVDLVRSAWNQPRRPSARRRLAKLGGFKGVDAFLEADKSQAAESG